MQSFQERTNTDIAAQVERLKGSLKDASRDEILTHLIVFYQQYLMQHSELLHVKATHQRMVSGLEELAVAIEETFEGGIDGN